MMNGKSQETLLLKKKPMQRRIINRMKKQQVQMKVMGLILILVKWVNHRPLKKKLRRKVIKLKKKS